MMKVEILESFIDKVTGDVYEVGDVVEMKDERIEEILSHPKKKFIKVVFENKKKGLK